MNVNFNSNNNCSFFPIEENLHKYEKNLIKDVFDKIIVVELYSDLINEDDESSIDLYRLKNEICGNGESGINLAKKFHPEIRFIYSNNDKVSQAVSVYAEKFFNFKGTMFNLYNNEINLDFGERSKLIIVAQGNPLENEIADFNANDFITTFLSDLNIEKLSEIEFHVCMLGRDENYLNEISNYFNKKTKILSYTDLITTEQSGRLLAFNENGQSIKLVTKVSS